MTTLKSEYELQGAQWVLSGSVKLGLHLQSLAEADQKKSERIAELQDLIDRVRSLAWNSMDAQLALNEIIAITEP